MKFQSFQPGQILPYDYMVNQITWENFFPVVQKRDPALPGWNLSHVIVVGDFWRVYSTAGIPAKRYRVSSWPTGIMCSPPKWNHWILRLKELRNCILCTIPVWSLFCSVRIYIILHFLPIILVKLDFCFSVF